MKSYLIMAMAAMMLTACEKVAFFDDTGTGDSAEEKTIVTLHFSPYATEDFTRAMTPLDEVCSRLSVGVFNADGTKIKSVNQKRGDAGFGTVSMSLTEGTYRVVAVAHNSTEGNATISSVEKITFASNKMTDTFSVVGTLNVGEDAIDENFDMKRVVGMVRLTFNENIPNNVQRLKFYYTGGSSTLNPSTGYGCVNSKQTEYRYTHDDNDVSINVYELYTAPHEQNDVLKITITAMDADGMTINEWTMEEVPVTKNKITTWTGTLFGNSGGDSGGTLAGGVSFMVDPEWNGEITFDW